MTQPDRTDIESIQRLLGDRYQLSWIIGRGGMSTVWLAWDKDKERDVAVKILKPEYTENDEFRKRFRNEAEASEEFHSDNVVATYDYGEVRGDNGAMFCFIIMEYVRGESLADVLSRESTLPESLALDVTTQVARGLQTIHEAGMVHRDIKPGNLLITPQGVVKITDFGIAKAAAAVPLTRTGMVVGTAQYVSPEQAQGQSVQAASDIYSLGVVTYEMVAGHRPFSGDSTISVAIKHISEAPPALPDTISGPMRELIGICLRKDPHARFANGGELAAATEYVHRGQRPPQPHRVPVKDVAVQPRTEQLQAVTQNPTTAVPPEQGPQLSPDTASSHSAIAPPVVAGVGGTATTSSENTPAGSPSPRNSAMSGDNSEPLGTTTSSTINNSAAKQAPGGSHTQRGVLIGLGILVLVALGVVGYMVASSKDDHKPDSEQPSVTQEHTTGVTSTHSEPTTEEQKTHTKEPETDTRQSTSTSEKSSEPSSSSTKPTNSQPTSETPTNPGIDEPNNPPTGAPKPIETPGNGNNGGAHSNASDTAAHNQPGAPNTPSATSAPGEMITAEE
ncbi:serine/threonine-protein kinase [Corynebacterium anserum]|nr:serine/threonine-protein kinase [Corynebacterium anserum]